eukprot:CAMPEP_0194274858 /NCGR_PEP_ID=MMETSP0169-20130528/7849_1 /TAXON_ID=218684 /ORGANISM="Corethron pennatum, Strain L29A3" /LENGTH=31 /DNA_ID= /DNA_START= /DNA_END= /DNA_ORIENTATION=
MTPSAKPKLEPNPRPTKKPSLKYEKKSKTEK